MENELSVLTEIAIKPTQCPKCATPIESWANSCPSCQFVLTEELDKKPLVKHKKTIIITLIICGATIITFSVLMLVGKQSNDSNVLAVNKLDIATNFKSSGPTTDSISVEKIDIFTKDKYFQEFLHNSHLDYSSEKQELAHLSKLMNNPKITDASDFIKINEAWQKFKIEYFKSNNHKFFEIGNFYGFWNNKKYFNIYTETNNAKTIFFQSGLIDIKNSKTTLKTTDCDTFKATNKSLKLSRMYCFNNIEEADKIIRDKFRALHPELDYLYTQAKTNFDLSATLGEKQRDGISLCIQLNESLSAVKRAVFADFNTGNILFEFSQADIKASFGNKETINYNEF